MTEPVEIVSTPDTCGGRYRYKGTRLPVGTIKNTVDLGGRDEVTRGWPYVTDAMIDAAMAFDWPAQCRAGISADSLTVGCVCGEAIVTDPVFGDEPMPETVTCVCGRVWRIILAVEPA
jgi:uncharacterized protein (DUF433 family)